MESLNREHLHSVLDGAVTSAPRYTSYPPANYMTQQIGDSEWNDILSEGLSGADTAISLYIHIPFCRTLCFYCACNRTITKNQAVVNPYLSAFEKECSAYKEILGLKEIDQIHIGGGTPNYLSPEQFLALHSALAGSFLKAQFASLSVELDPRTCTTEHLKTLSTLGCKRISVGVQDFEPAVQKAINRIQSFEETRDTLNAAREVGISTVAADLIYGLPLQTRESFRRTAEKVIDLRPERIAVYGYAHVQGLAPGQRAFSESDLPAAHERLDLLLDAINCFKNAGYRYIGMDHFVLPDDPLAKAVDNDALGRSFMGYVSNRGVSVLGLGTSSISLLPNALVQNVKEPERYQEIGASRKFAVERGVLRNEYDRAAGDIIESILTVGKVNFASLVESHGQAGAELIKRAQPELEYFQTIGLIVIDSDGFKLTESGQIFGRQISKSFDYRSSKGLAKSPQAAII